MVTASSLAIFTFCLVGCGLTSFFLGRRDGIEATVDYLIEIGVLEAEAEDD
jgi:hypothetical protein